MRKFIGVCAGLAVVVLVYWAWPFVGAAQLAAIASQGDVAAVMQRVDLPSLRRSLGSQIVRAFLKQNPKYQKLGSLGRGLAGSVGGSVADALLQEVLTPENVAALLAKGRIDAAEGAAQDSAAQPLWQMPSLDEAFRSNPISTLLDSYFDGPVSFVVVLDSGGARYGVHLRLSGATWLMSGLNIPPEICDRLAREVAARQDASGT